MISTLEIERGKVFIICELIHHVVNSWQRISIRICVCIDGLRIVDTHAFPMFARIILTNYNLSTPWWPTLFNNTFFQQCINLIFDEFLVFLAELAGFTGDGFDVLRQVWEQGLWLDFSVDETTICFTLPLSPGNHEFWQSSSVVDFDSLVLLLKVDSKKHVRA